MKQNEISDLPKLDEEAYENIFDVYLDENGLYFYNLIETIQFPTNLPPNLFESYNIKPGDTWPLISYKNFRTPNLWWLILLANQIDNPTILPKPGDVILIPIEQVVKEVLSNIVK